MIDRRQILALLAGATAAPSTAMAQVSRMTAYAFTFTGLKGGDIRLSDYAGKPVLVVNTASQCGYTPQYAGLQQLWTRYNERGLVIIGVPSNDFGGQEPGGASEIEHTAHQSYGVTFPLAAKAGVRTDPHPFYKWAAAEKPLELPRWNFHKYLIGRDGHVVGSFPAQVAPDDPKLIAAIDKELARSA